MRFLALVAAAATTLTLAGGVSTASTAGAQSYYNFFGGYGGASRIPKEMVRIKARYRTGTLIVSFADRRLYRILGKGRAMSYPIAAPRAISRWAGTLRVSQKRVNPQWTPTASMRRENPKLPITVAGGDPRNPLGTRALYLGSTMYRIHGTDAPWTIGKAVSKGCIRMYNAHAEEVYAATRVGARVVVNWKRYTPRSRHMVHAFQDEPRRSSRNRSRGRRAALRDDTASFFSEAFGF